MKLMLILKVTKSLKFAFINLLSTLGNVVLYIYLKPKVTLHCYYIYHFWVLVSDILNVFNSYQTSINYSCGS